MVLWKGSARWRLFAYESVKFILQSAIFWSIVAGLLVVPVFWIVFIWASLLLEDL